MERAGVAVQVWPVGVARLPAWIRARMRARGLDPTAEAVALISERVEGNLLAAAQEIDKLFLLHGGGRIDAADVTDAVADSARFTVFALVDCVLAADEARAVRVLEGLRGEGASPVMIASVLAREVRNLGSMRRAIARGESPGRVLAAHRVWESRKSAVTAALKRHRPEHWDDLLRACARLDRVVKGQAPGNPWDELIQLALWIAGKRPLVAAV